MPLSRKAKLTGLFGAAMTLCAATPASAAATVQAGDTAVMLFATILVLLMAVPGLALFYGGLVRTKNVLSMIAQVFSLVCLVALAWVLFGYSLSFSAGSVTGVFGGASKLLLRGVGIETTSPTSGIGFEIPEYVFLTFHMLIACIAPTLLVGAFAERMRYPALLVLVFLWVTLVYFPLAHMTWFWAGPEAVSEAARGVAQASTTAQRQIAQLNLQSTLGAAGLFRQWGVIDVAGAAAIHIGAGIAGLIGSIYLGQRVGYGRVSMAPNNLALTTLGGGLLWVGWLGYIVGMGLRANGTTGLMVLNAMLCASAAAWSWTAAEWKLRGKPSLLGMISGAISGLVSITAAAAVASPIGAIALGLGTGAATLWACTSIKSRYNYDDALDVFGVHCVAGTVGLLAAAILANPAFGGLGIPDYVSRPGEVIVAVYEPGKQMLVQIKVLVVTLLWSGIVTDALMRFVNAMVGLRAQPRDELRGMDLVDHGEQVYND